MCTYPWPFGHKTQFISNSWPWFITYKVNTGQCKDGFELVAYGFPFAPIQYGDLAQTVWPQHAIYRFVQCLKMDGLEFWDSRSKHRWNVKMDLNSQHMVSYLLPYNMGTYLWPFGHNTPFFALCSVWKRMTLNCGFQGQHRWNVKMDLNSQQMVSICSPYIMGTYLWPFGHKTPLTVVS